jgi:hypothetical protein
MNGPSCGRAVRRLFSALGAGALLGFACWSPAWAQAEGEANDTSPPVTLEIRVKSDDGTPVRGAEVIVRAAGQTWRSQTTGQAGHVVFSDLPRGGATVFVIADSMASFRQQLRIDADDEERQELVITLQPAQ